MDWNKITQKAIIDPINKKNNLPPPLLKPSKFDDILRQANANEIIFTLTGFTVNKFLYLYSVVEEALTPGGQGKKSKITPKDAFLFTILHLKTNQSPNEIAASFNFTSEATFRAIKKTIHICRPIFEDQFIKMYSMEEQLANNWVVKEFPNCLLVVDSTFQPTTKPNVGFKGAKLMFSGKHYSYGYKTQCLHAMNGICVRFDSPFYGAQHDFDIFNSTLPNFTFLLRKSDPEYYNIMADLGYVGDVSIQGVKLITPFKNTDNITAEELKMNRLISSKRIICENYYGRLKGKFKIMRDKFTLSKQQFVDYVGMCIALTNFHVMKYPLRDADGEFNQRYEQTLVDDMYHEYLELKRKRKHSHQRRRQKIAPMNFERKGSVVSIGSQESEIEIMEEEERTLFEDD